MRIRLARKILKDPIRYSPGRHRQAAIRLGWRVFGPWAMKMPVTNCAFEDSKFTHPEETTCSIDLGWIEAKITVVG